VDSPNETITPFEELAQMHKCIDAPRANQTIYDECISIAGWVFVEGRDPAGCRVRAWFKGALIGETRLLFPRSEVSEFLSLPRDAPTAFRFLARAAGCNESSPDATIQLTVSWNGDAAEYLIGKVSVHLVPAFLQKRHFGEVVFPTQSRVLHRQNIYGSGPPVLEPNVEMLRLILDYLSPRSSVVDVGCGAGAYGPALIMAGHQWTGVEVNPHCWQLLEERDLSFRKTPPEAARFPCVDEEFDEAICIEVLEHIEHPEPFLEEISRIIRHRAIFSVPNIEVIPYFKDWETVPWHMLERDHKNFFTRTSLSEHLAPHFSRVEVFSYIEHPLRTRDGIALHAHLCAVAEKQYSDATSTKIQ
jgi:2-polyprenyl-3-methyl-5-hydroxy-6-metoxy-1,4-benzoquinol methylase